MTNLNDSTRDEILRRVALLAAEIAESVAPLVEATHRNPGMFGDQIVHPTPLEVGGALRLKADELRRFFPEVEDPQTETTL